jgi:hypothetical protein
MTASASLLDLLDLDPSEDAAARRFGIAGRVGELVAAEVVQHEVDAVPGVDRTLHDGLPGALWQAARLLTGASLLLSLLPRRGRRTRAAAGITGIAGSLAAKFAVFHAGKASARDPHATFRSQRAAGR